MKHLLTLLLCILAFPVLDSPALADEPVIETVTRRANGANWQFSVTLSHPDSGWDHYADGWRVLDMAGNELGLRTLVHPHEQEQPFTRSLGGVALAAGTSQVQIQARCLLDGWGSTLTTVTLP